MILFLGLLAIHFCCRTAVGSHWYPVAGHDQTNSRRIMMREGSRFHATAQTFVITHGLNGTKSDDRFHQLADTISDFHPSANVLILDWSRQSQRRNFLGFVCPLTVSKEIDTVGDWFAEQLRTLAPDLSSTTFIGESFGNCVNARIAQGLGSTSRFLVFNPASSLGGYQLPDLRPLTSQSWSFATFSTFDCQDARTDVGLFLKTPAEFDESCQHTFGITWLRTQILTGHIDWLNMTLEVPQSSPERFDGIAELDGTFVELSVPRKRPVPKTAAPPKSPDQRLMAELEFPKA